MSDQMMPGAAAPADAPPSPGPGADPYKIHDHALQAEKHIEAVATLLGQSGAEPKILKAVSTCAEIMRTLVKTMAKAPSPPAPRGRAGMAAATDTLASQAKRY